MGERKGTNKYYPPDFDPKKHRSLAGYHGQHPLRERARKMHQGILVIRFEMPYNIWCDGCGNHVGMGVRYNAEKSKIGNYYTTPIYKFRMKCHLCDNYIEMKTDPANHDYVIISGARRKEQRWDPKENEQIVPEDKASQKKLALDAMYRLEHGVEDKAKLKGAIPGIAQIQHMQSQYKDDYILNKIARNKFRDEKQSLKMNAAQDHALLEKSSLDIHLLKEHEDDIRMAGLMKYSTVQTYDEKQQQKRREIEQRGLFSPVAASISSPESSMSSSTSNMCHSNAKNRLAQAVSKTKVNPFSSPGLSSNASKSLSAKALGIVKKSRKPTEMHSHGSDNQESGHISNGMKSVSAARSETVGDTPAELSSQGISKQTLTEENESSIPGCDTHDSDSSSPGDVPLQSSLMEVNEDAAPCHKLTPNNSALLALGSNYDSTESDSS